MFRISLIISLLLTLALSHSEGAEQFSASKEIDRGVWVTCFTKKKVLYSAKAVRDLVDFCKTHRINQIYLQVYRANQAYYDSDITDNTPFLMIRDEAGFDSLNYLIQQAQEEEVEVYAWINALSLSTNRRADILKTYGTSILTRDQHLRNSFRREEQNKSDKYYLRETQYFIEPADPRVADYVDAIIREVITKYPGFSGIHLDYIRYPQPVPFVPGSRFNDIGLTYGYGERSLELFKKEYGYDPLKVRDRARLEVWDDWKRDAITKIVRNASMFLKENYPEKRLSCAVIPSVERAYQSAFQNWPHWLKEKIIDYVVLMNYSTDIDWTVYATQAGLGFKSDGGVYVGLGSYLFEESREELGLQYKHISKLDVDGIVFFSYDDLDAQDMQILQP